MFIIVRKKTNNSFERMNKTIHVVSDVETNNYSEWLHNAYIILFCVRTCPPIKHCNNTSSTRVDRVGNVQGPEDPVGPKPTLDLGPLAVPCPWTPEGLPAPVTSNIDLKTVLVLSLHTRLLTQLHCVHQRLHVFVCSYIFFFTRPPAHQEVK